MTPLHALGYPPSPQLRLAAQSFLGITPMIVIAVLHAAAVAYLIARAVAIPSRLRQAGKTAYRTCVHRLKRPSVRLGPYLPQEGGFDHRNDRLYLLQASADPRL